MSDKVYNSMSIANPNPPHIDTMQKVYSAIGGLGLLILFVAWSGVELGNRGMWLAASLSMMGAGIILYSHRAYNSKIAGVKNDGNFLSGVVNRGLWAWMAGIVITGFYIILYFFPQYMGLAGEGQSNTGLVALFDPLSQLLKGSPASQWFVYGTLYTSAIVFFGIKFIFKYRHNKYQIFRTLSVMFFQLGFAFLIPEIMQKLNQPYYNFANMWPLNYYFFDEWNIKGFIDAGGMGMLMLGFGLAMIFIISPILTYFYGKRWYCSWVCGCGGLAETAGDPFRHLSDKSTKAWKIERWLIHSVLLFSIIMTVGVVYSLLKNNPDFQFKSIHFLILLGVLNIAFWLMYKMTNLLNDFAAKAKNIFGGVIGVLTILTVIAHFTGNNSAILSIDSYSLRSTYGFLIGSVFSGVIGVGFYPLMGSRVWCRFGCPMAAILGIQQKFFSRFRITTNGSQCISCGNCSTYCEMGIDVRAYAQKGQNIVRASCVGCGVCAAVCPRGVLKLENGSADISDRTTELKAIHISEDMVKIL